MTKPRSELFFHVVQTPDDADYVPSRKRSPELIERFEGKPPGVVIAWQQKVGTAAVAQAFERIGSTGDRDDTLELAEMASYLAIGTAYHLFAQKEAKRVMYRRVRIPRMIDPETGKRTSEQELVESAQAGLAHAAQLAIVIDEMVNEERSIGKQNEQLGLSLATTGMTLAVIGDSVASLRDDAEDMQWHTWQAAQGSYLRTFELSGLIGVRPTFAQLADDQSPYRRYLNDDSESVTQTVFETLINEVDIAVEQ